MKTEHNAARRSQEKGDKGTLSSGHRYKRPDTAAKTPLDSSSGLWRLYLELAD